MKPDIIISAPVGRRLFREEGGARQARKEWGAHESVLTGEVLEHLHLKNGDIVVDATAGAGGHSEAMLRAADIRLIAIDADPAAVADVTARLARFGECAEVVEGNFKMLRDALAARGYAHADKILFDLGWNRGQLGAGRGLSFQGNEPLNMSYSPRPASGFTAEEIVNTWKEETIADALFGYGEERYARRIAKNIVEARKKSDIKTTGELVDIIARSVPAAYRHGRIHFATRTFQALRIAVNDELGVLDTALRAAWDVLAPQGRIAVISFHSIEDRAVKRLMKEFSEDGGVLATKKPVTASMAERAANPSARSAKLRVIEKVA